jgi:hypothetical protein
MGKATTRSFVAFMLTIGGAEKGGDSWNSPSSKGVRNRNTN